MQSPPALAYDELRSQCLFMAPLRDANRPGRCLLMGAKRTSRGRDIPVEKPTKFEHTRTSGRCRSIRAGVWLELPEALFSINGPVSDGMSVSCQIQSHSSLQNTSNRVSRVIHRPTCQRDFAIGNIVVDVFGERILTGLI